MFLRRFFRRIAGRMLDENAYRVQYAFFAMVRRTTDPVTRPCERNGQPAEGSCA
jgi:hypothetical protein